MAFTGKAFLYTAPWLALLPDGMYFDTCGDKLDFQASSQKASVVREQVSKTFELTEPWKKQYNESCGWWEYTNKTNNGISIKVYADREGPESCKKIVEVTTEEENVPVKFEKQMVTRERVRWECPKNKEEAL